MRELLPNRSADAVELVRQGIDQWHRRGDSPLSSHLMKRMLETDHP